MTFRSALFSLAMLLAGCTSNGYKEFYTSVPGATPDAVAAIRAAPPRAQPAVERTASLENVLESYLRKGYTAIGYSSFSAGGGRSEAGAISYAKELKADLVLIVNPTYRESVTASVPITLPTSTTSQTNGSATVSGPGGTANVYGQSTTTTYGSRTTYLPMRIDRYNYGAVYFVMPRISFGANYADLSDEERRQLQTNKGVRITLVIDKSPAYESDILPGDFIISVDGTGPSGVNGFAELIDQNRGRTVELTISRGGSQISKRVRLLD